MTRLTAVWILLLSLCLISFYVAEGRLAGPQLIAIIFAVALGKLALVAAAFMELWPRPYFYIAMALFAVTLGAMALAW